MISDIMARVETILESSALSELEKDNLSTIVSNLHKELDEVPDHKREEAVSVAHFTEVATRESIRAKKDEKLIQHATDGLDHSVKSFSVDHPKIAELVNKLCNFFSDSGI